MKCLQVRRWLSMYQDGHLAGREAAGVAAHLRGCAACRVLGDQMIAVEDEVRATVREEWGASPHLHQRVIDHWLAERAAACSPARPLCFPHPSRQAVLSRRVAASLAAALLIAGGLAWQQWDARGRGQRQQIVRDVEPEQRIPIPNSDTRARADNQPPHGLRRPAPPNGSYRHSIPRTAAHDAPHAPSTAKQRTPSRAGDLAYWNADPEKVAQQWASMTEDERDRIERRVRQEIRTKDDFITLPFPLLASTSPRQITEAVDSYKREAAIVDPRLAREVNCAFKGTALSDLCSQLRSDTGIELTAAPSVADEKVTVFCEKMPLRDVMRQLSRPFGYTWLRSRQSSVVSRQSSGEGPSDSHDPRLTPHDSYRYELEQDLRSQLLEEELRNRDRDAALLDLQREIDRYQPYLSLSPDEALARAKTAAPEEKKLLETYAGWGWGPLQLYARLSPQEQAALRAGQTLSFSGDPDQVARDGVLHLPPELERGVLQSMRDVRVRRPGSQDPSGNHPGIGSAQNLPDGVPPTASPEAHGVVVLRIGHSELGQFTFDGGSGVTVGNNIIVRGLVRDLSGDAHGAGDQPLTGVTGHDSHLGQGVSPAVQDPKNEIANARLAQAPALQRPVTVEAEVSGQGSGANPAGSPQSKIQTPRGHPKSKIDKVTTADVLEALHRASGLPIVADFYTHLYSPTAVSVNGQSLFAALNHLADAMHMRWHKDDRWLQFRSVSYLDDRAKEVPNRLLSRWASARRQHDGLPLDDLIEMAQLSDAQLDSSFVGEGVKERWGLAEWSMARNPDGRLHLRYLAQLTPAQRELALSAQGLPFSRLSPTQQQGLIAHLGDRLRSLDELAGATVQVEFTHPGSFRWPAVNMQRPSGAPNLFGLAQVCEPTQAAALAGARRLDAGVSPAQITPTDLSLAVVYTLIDPKTGKARELGLCEHADGTLISQWLGEGPGG